MVVALLSVTKAAMEGHPDNIDRSCLKKLMRLPRFLLTTTYYVGSITILVTVFRMNFIFILWLYFLNNALLYFHIFPSVSSLRDNCLFRTSINFLTVSRQLSIWQLLFLWLFFLSFKMFFFKQSAILCCFELNHKNNLSKEWIITISCWIIEERLSEN